MRRGWQAALALVAASAGAGVVLMRAPAPTSQTAVAERPRLALLTSLPLLFGESFALERPRNPAVDRIEGHFTLVPVPMADRASLKGHSRLLMAHPRAQPAEVLVELDEWVRAGGQVVLLADPQLKWESRRMIGDRLRPPPDFADTGLLAHWGLALGVDEDGNAYLRATGPGCATGHDRLAARCTIGRGTARVIADADFLMGEGPDASRRLDLLMSELNRLESR